MENIYKREMRFLITKKCNYRCSFCHGEGLQSPKKDLLTAEDIGFIYSVGRDYFGINTATLTGGEPLVRSDVADIVTQLSHEGCTVTITTNGYLLSNCMRIGSNVACLNISLHTLDEDMYNQLVRHPDAFRKMISNLRTFRTKYPNVEICLNCTLVSGVNSDKQMIANLLKFAEDMKASIKFIELFPKNSNGYVPLNELRSFLYELGFYDIPSSVRKEKYTNDLIEVGLTKIFCAKACEEESPADYCRSHNDLFVSPDGKIKPCRYSEFEVDILTAVKNRSVLETRQGIEQAFDLLGNNCVCERRT